MMIPSRSYVSSRYSSIQTRVKTIGKLNYMYEETKREISSNYSIIKFYGNVILLHPSSEIDLEDIPPLFTCH